MTPHQKEQLRYERENVAAANLILADIEAFGGESAGVVIWARLTVLHEQSKRLQVVGI